MSMQKFVIIVFSATYCRKTVLVVCLLLGRSTVSSCDQPGCYINCYMSTPSWQWLIVSILFISTPWNVNSSLYKLLGTIRIHEMYVFYIYNLLSVRNPCRMGQFVFHNPNYCIYPRVTVQLYGRKYCF